MSRDGSGALAARMVQMPSLAISSSGVGPANSSVGVGVGVGPANSSVGVGPANSSVGVGPANSSERLQAVSAVVPTFDDVYAMHVAYVWRVLRTLGVADAQLEDAVQDVFVVVHRRLAEWEGRAAMTTWLFAIARRVASSHRRRSPGVRTEELRPEDEPAGGADTFAELSRAQAAATVMSLLMTLDEDKRTVFALVELEQLSVPEVARMLDLNLNTAYSRLRLARAAFEAAAKALGAKGGAR